MARTEIKVPPVLQTPHPDLSEQPTGAALLGGDNAGPPIPSALPGEGPADLDRTIDDSPSVESQSPNDAATQAAFRACPFETSPSGDIEYMRVRETLKMITNAAEYFRVDSRITIKQGKAHLIVRGLRITGLGVVAITYTTPGVPPWMFVPWANVSHVSPKP